MGARRKTVPRLRITPHTFFAEAYFKSPRPPFYNAVNFRVVLHPGTATGTKPWGGTSAGTYHFVVLKPCNPLSGEKSRPCFVILFVGAFRTPQRDADGTGRDVPGFQAFGFKNSWFSDQQPSETLAGRVRFRAINDAWHISIKFAGPLYFAVFSSNFVVNLELGTYCSVRHAFGGHPLESSSHNHS